MPVAVSYPGVYIQEKSSGVRTITGVATSIAGFVDWFPRGLLNEAVQCLSYADFEREFGGIHTYSPASYGVKQFFQNGGSECWVVRVANVTDAGLGTTAAVASNALIDDTPVGTAGTDLFNVVAGRRIRGEAATNPGAWGDSIYLEVDYETSDPATQFNLVVSEIITENGRRVVRNSETFRNLTMDPGAVNYVIEVVNAGSRLVQLNRNGLTAITPPVPPATWPRPAATGTIGGGITAAPPASPIDLTINAGGGARTVTVTYIGTMTHPALRPLLEAGIRAAAIAAATPGERALLSGASVKLLGNGTTANPYRYMILAGRGGADFDPTARLTPGGADSAALGLDPAAAPPNRPIVNDQQYNLDNGDDGSDGATPSTPRVGAAALTGVLAAKTGIYALEDVDLVNILCIPRAAELDEVDMRQVYSDATTYIAARRGFLLIDIPESTASLEAMQTWLTQNDSLRNKNAAVYFPRTFVPDPANGNRLRGVAASGTIAGLYARTDANRGVWKAPAGTEARLQNVQGLAYLLTDPQNGALNPLGANCLRTFPVYGNLCWGARTLDGADQLASEWKYIPIVRLALFIEESLFRGTKWVVFEPNDEPLWSQIRLNVGVFMNGLFRQGAFQGQTPQEAYFVKCDKETTTQADRNLGIVNIEVGFAPLKPAEFVVITIQQIAGDLQT
jgi:phage tail sheath protein FI